MPGETVLPADLAALQRAVAGEEAPAERLPLVEDHREATIDLAKTVAQAQQHQG